MGTNEYYEQVLRVIAGLDSHSLKAMVVTDRKWYEIDDAQDKDIAETLFSGEPEENVRRMAKRFGGYWRFPAMRDFCYLVNPSFPPEQMRREMRASFGDLMAYPSGLETQNLLSGKLFEVDPAHILTGNGAAELIRGLTRVIRGRVGIIYPSFNEYPETLSQCGVLVPLCAEAVTYTAEQVIAWAGSCDVVALVNPDNPSGNYIPMRDLRSVLEYMESRGKTLVLDESFVDFTDECGDRDENAGMLAQPILEAFPRLIVIKSLSKCYGIPGLRLGVLACGDREVIRQIRESLPVWNINSCAEYFLQIIGKYRAAYRQSCRSVAAERRRFKCALEQTGLFTVYPSQANYFLCRCAGDFTAKILTAYLLDSRNIFIKDLTGKNGLSGPGWIRLVIRSRSDNDLLLEALRSFPPQPPAVKGCFKP
jgi:histidinol-phosphate/aromatic aminotransferase/cobyric acid decarboxylase-like protein